MMTLPRFKGWIIDIESREFKRLDESNQEAVYLGFEEEEGDELLGEYADTLDESKPKEALILEQIRSVMKIDF